MEVFTEAQKPLREPPDCPACGHRVREAWVYIGTSWNPDQWTPGRWVCRTSGCQYA